MYLELASFPGNLQLHAVIDPRSVQKQRYHKQSKMRAREGQETKLLRMFSRNLLGPWELGWQLGHIIDHNLRSGL